MKKRFSYSLFFLTGCLSLFSQTPLNDKIVNESYGFKVIMDGISYTDKTGDYVFYAEPDYIDFCNTNFGLDSKIPFVDFNEESAIIVFKKGNNGSHLFIDSAVETEKFIRVAVKMTPPLNGVKSEKAKTKYLIVKVKKSNKEIVVVYL